MEELCLCIYDLILLSEAKSLKVIDQQQQEKDGEKNMISYKVEIYPFQFLMAISQYPFVISIYMNMTL